LLLIFANDPQAYYYLGEMYGRGYGVDQSQEKSLLYFYKSASLGYAPAIKYCEGLDMQHFTRLTQIKSRMKDFPRIITPPSQYKITMDVLDLPYLGNIQFLGLEDISLQSFEDTMKPLQSKVEHIQDFAKSSLAFANSISNEHNFSIDVIAAINIYTREWKPREKSLYYQLNTALRSEERFACEAFLPYIKLLIHGLKQLPPFKGTIWRGVNGDVRERFVNQEVVFAAFTSCSVGLSSAGGNFFGKQGLRTLLNIKSHQGRNIAAYSSFKKESEILLLPNSRFKVIDVLQVSEGLFIVQLKQLE